MQSFGEWITHYRHASRDTQKGSRLTQSRLAELLNEYDDTLIYTKTQISNWEKDKRTIPLDKRPLLIGFIYVFTTCGGISKLDEANDFLQSGGYAPLTKDEVESLPNKKLYWNQPSKTETHSLLTIAGILSRLEKQAEDNEKLKNVLAEIEGERLRDIANISQTQRRILEVIPYQATPLDDVFAAMHQISSLEDVRIKELNLRLHELRYLGLIARRKDPQYRWLYWREIPRSFFA